MLGEQWNLLPEWMGSCSGERGCLRGLITISPITKNVDLVCTYIQKLSRLSHQYEPHW